LSGAIIETFTPSGGTYPLEAYRMVFGLQAALVLIALIRYLSSSDKYLDNESALQ
jgi:hypothetical protein